MFQAGGRRRRVCHMAGEVSPVGDPGNVPARAELRASHADRDRVVEVLRIAAGDGMLTAEELDQRLEAALTARTLAELAGLTTDLLAAPALRAAPAPPAAPEARDLVTIECGSSSVKREGHWIVPRRMDIRVASGSVTLDFTEAAISGPTLLLDAEVQSGSVTLVTKPGIVVDTDAVSVVNGSVKVKSEPDPQVPVALQVRVSGKVGSGSIKARPPRRTFSQWLTRRPGP
jgi:Domain of unknown function (DUF1707)